MILYHGSNIDIKDEFLKPHNPFFGYGYSERICFSADENVALLYSINPVKSYLENLQTKEETIPAFSVHLKLDGKPYLIYELYEGMFEELFNKTCYIYKCDVDDSIVKNANNGFEKYVEQKVDITKKIIVENCLQKLKELEKQSVWKRHNRFTQQQLCQRCIRRSSQSLPISKRIYSRILIR